MRAILKPRIQSPHADEYLVTMLARTGNDKIVVQGLNEGAPVHSVDRWRLYSEHHRLVRIFDAEFAKLRWNGKGPDPLALKPDKMPAAIEERP